MTPQNLLQRFGNIIETVQLRPGGHRRYPKEFKKAVVHSITEGHATEVVARILKIPLSTVTSWRDAAALKKYAPFVPVQITPPACENEDEIVTNDESEDAANHIVIETSGGCRIFIPV
jgi:transposase-like protein